MLREDAWINHADLEADRLLARRDGLFRRKGVLCAADTDDAERLRLGLTQAFGAARRKKPITLEIARPSGKASYQLLILPRRLRATGSAALYVTAFVTDPMTHLGPVVSRLRRQYGLTRQEAEAVTALTRGATRAEVCVRLSVTVEGLDTLMHSAMTKTQTADPEALIRLVLSSALGR